MSSRGPLESRFGPYAALVGLALIWGVSFLLIKITVHDMSPEALLLFRSASGFVALGAILVFSGRKVFSPGWRRLIPSFVIMALTNAILPWIAIAWGEERISSGLASILNSTTTLWTALFIYWVMPSERPSLINYVGVVVGFAGVVVLVYPEVEAQGLSGSALGALAVVLASLSYAVNALYQRRKMRDVPVAQISLGQLAASAIIALPIAAPSLPAIHLRFISVAAVLTLGAVCTGVAYLLYYYILNSLGAVRAAGVTYLVPITAVFWGAVLLGETISVTIVVGGLVILAGIVLTSLRASPVRPATVEADTAAA